jgi:hypothetical protein
MDGRDEPGHNGEGCCVIEISRIHPLEHQRGVGAAEAE